MKIKRLDPVLANQIAAGEVIERPASVVKELLENAIDAGAKQIQVDIKGAGSELIRVRDDGHGIAHEDMAMAIASHATSKISTTQDLFAIHSLGFRGEALASISSISRFKIYSKTQHDKHGHRLRHQGRDTIVEIEPYPHPNGTTVEVYDLFFNTPARRKFLKSAKTEFQHIENTFKRIAMSHFEVAFQLRHDEKTLCVLPKASTEQQQRQRIGKIFGKRFIEQCFDIEAVNEGVRLQGWVGNPEFMRSQNDLQYFYINGRLVRDKLLNHAIRVAFDQQIHPGRQVSYLLYLTVPVDELDVNVHPSKNEVRFSNARMVHDFLQSEISRGLAQFDNASQTGIPLTPEAKEFRQGNPYPHAQASIIRSMSKASPSNIGAKLCTILDRFWLIDWQKELYLCDYRRLYQDYTKGRLNNTLKLESRPLLVPVIIEFKTSRQLERLMEIQPLLSTCAIEFSAMDETRLVLRGFPILTPFLKFETFFERLASQSEVAKTDVFHFLATYNDAEVLDSTLEEQLLHYLFEENRSANFKGLRKIDSTEWERLLYA